MKLALTPHDWLPLIPAQIKIQGIDEEEAWRWLQNEDPLFTRELPKTDKAITLYAHYLNKFLDSKGRKDRIRAAIETDSKGDPQWIVFLANAGR